MLDCIAWVAAVTVICAVPFMTDEVVTVAVMLWLPGVLKVKAFTNDGTLLLDLQMSQEQSRSSQNIHAILATIAATVAADQVITKALNCRSV